MSDMNKKELMIKIVRIYLHTFLTDPFTEIIP